ncbi:MATE family efflux transporter [Arenicella xantha]|uniref:Na+-driven multidrug efflux pump n=1 Tax=Arenicella xantha TaxID=644221 RepID=A0A395JKI8_9GAMM|nr:MATE family efflux transporter [Arenicella xantha]RBP49711.1 Na+-driven multidrug efflux pump [Arenicella xantha]
MLGLDILKFVNTHLRTNLALAWPLAINVLLVQSMLMIDTLLVAPLGEVPVAAMGIAAAILAFALGIELAIGNGIQLLVGRAYGANKSADLVVAFWVGLFVNLFTAVAFFAILSGFDDDIVAALTSNPAVEQRVLSYLGITKYIVIITAFTQVCTAFYNGRGDTKVTLKGYLIEIPLNAILSYFLIYGVGGNAGLGLEGAALGSLTAVFLRATYFTGVLLLDKRVHLRYPRGRPLHAEMGPQLAEILPIAANFFVLFIGASVYQLLFAQLALSSFVAITLIFPWLRIGTQVISAWAQASAINISQALGNNTTQHLAAFVSVCIRTALGLSLAVAVLFFIFSQFIQFIYPNIEPATYAALSVIAPLYILLPIVRGYNSVSANILRALGESKRVLKLHFVTQWLISLPVCAVLILYCDVSLFWAFAIMPIEELLKTFHFYRYTRMKLDSEY